MNGSPMNRNRRAAAPRAITRKTGRTACRMSMASSLLQAKRAIPGKGPPARAAPGEKGARPRGYSPSLLPRRTPFRDEVVDDPPRLRVRDGASVPLLHPRHGRGPARPVLVLSQRAAHRMADRALGFEQRLRFRVDGRPRGGRVHAAAPPSVRPLVPFADIVRPPPRKVRRLNRERGSGGHQERSSQNRTDPFPVHCPPPVLCVVVTSRARRRGTRGSSRHPRRRSSPPSSPASP